MSYNFSNFATQKCLFALAGKYQAWSKQENKNKKHNKKNGKFKS